VPHGWEAGVVFDETTGTCSAAISSRWGPTAQQAPTTSLEPALAGDQRDDYGSWSLRPTTGDAIRRLAELDVMTWRPCTAAFTVTAAPRYVGLAAALDCRISR
jgi:hypothetical protein